MLSPTVTRLLGRTNAMGVGQTLSAVAILLMAFWQHPVGGPLLYAVSAGAISMFNVQIMSVRQALIPEHLLGPGAGRLPHGDLGRHPGRHARGRALGAWLGLPAVFVDRGPGRHRPRPDHLGRPARSPARDRRGVRRATERSTHRNPPPLPPRRACLGCRHERLRRCWTGPTGPGTSSSAGAGEPGSAGDAPIIEPATGAELGRTGRAGVDDVATARRSAAEAQQDWAALPHTQRAAVLRKAGDLFTEHGDELAGWNVREVGAVPGMAGLRPARRRRGVLRRRGADRALRSVS